MKRVKSTQANRMPMQRAGRSAVRRLHQLPISFSNFLMNPVNSRRSRTGPHPAIACQPTAPVPAAQRAPARRRQPRCHLGATKLSATAVIAISKRSSIAIGKSMDWMPRTRLVISTRLTGRRIVDASNRICIYSPRFAAVRKIDGLGRTQYNQVVTRIQDQAMAESSRRSDFSTTTLQNLQPNLHKTANHSARNGKSYARRDG